MTSTSFLATSTLERGEYKPVEAAGTSSCDGVAPCSRFRALAGTAAFGVLLGAAALAAFVVSRRGAAAARGTVATEGPELKASFGDDAWNAWGRSVSDFAATSALKPSELRHDGNRCEDSEELHAGLCYKKCELLTDGAYPVRCSAFSCGSGHPCTLENQHVAGLVPGEGYDVNGHGGWPHAPGACLLDEEYFLGLCYKKCSILTNGSFPYRSASATCCKDAGFRCLNIFTEDKTDKKFDVGGGRGDGDASTPGHTHVPLQRLTEGTGPETQRRSVHSVAASDVAPAEHRHDGNKCEDNEELYANLCYKRCAHLTDGEYPIRATAFSCCKERPCGVANEKTDSVIPCQGYDVSGRDGCPHLPGACLVDEEYFLGLCYKQCAVLTNGTYPHRATPFTCCKDDGLDCYNPFGKSAKSSDEFGVAGGSEDRDFATPGRVHGPLVVLTEAV